MQSQSYLLSGILPPAPKTVRGQPSSIDANANYLLYFNGCTAVLRPHSSSELPLLYVIHSCDVSAVKFSHDGKLVASIDVKGTLLVHEVCKDKLLLTKTYDNFLLGSKSIDWSYDRKKICVVGSGKNQFGRVASVDMGTNVGEITAVSAGLNSVCFRGSKNNKIVAGGDEYTLKVYQGPPFKFIKSNQSHTGYINQLKYSSNGKFLASVGADRRIVIYDGQTCQKIVEKQNAHNGGVMGVDWIDDQHIVTVSSDKFIKLWDTQLNELNKVGIGSEEQINNPKSHQQCLLAVRCHSNRIYGVCLNGDIAVVENMKVKEWLVGVRGKPIQTMSIGSDIIIVDNYGRILTYNQKGVKSIEGDKDIKLILGGCYDNQCLYVLLGDSKVYAYDLKSYQLIGQYQLDQAKFITSTQKGYTIASTNKLTNHIHSQTLAKTNLEQQPSILSSSWNRIAVGTIKGFIYIYNIKLQLSIKFQNTISRVSQILFHEQLLFTGDSIGKVKVWKLGQSLANQIQSQFGNHTSVITSISVNKGIIYTFSLDSKMNIWTIDTYKRLDEAKQLHKGGIIHGRVKENMIMTCGNDLLFKIHKICN